MKNKLLSRAGGVIAGKCKLKVQKKDISDHTDRMYVFIETPISYHSTQFTAHEIS